MLNVSPVIYEITASVTDDMSKSFEEYLTSTHIPDLLATGAFVEAKFLRSIPGRYRIVYEARSRQSLNSYLSDQAPTLREDMIKHFPGGVELSREEWTILARFDCSEYQK